MKVPALEEGMGETHMQIKAVAVRDPVVVEVLLNRDRWYQQTRLGTVEEMSMQEVEGVIIKETHGQVEVCRLDQKLGGQASDCLLGRGHRGSELGDNNVLGRF
jgi:hypothetical protein